MYMKRHIPKHTLLFMKKTISRYMKRLGSNNGIKTSLKIIVLTIIKHMQRHGLVYILRFGIELGTKIMEQTIPRYGQRHIPKHGLVFILRYGIKIMEQTIQRFGQKTT